MSRQKGALFQGTPHIPDCERNSSIRAMDASANPSISEHQPETQAHALNQGMCFRPCVAFRSKEGERFVHPPSVHLSTETVLEIPTTHIPNLNFSQQPALVTISVTMLCAFPSSV